MRNFVNGKCPCILQFYPWKHSFNFVKLPKLLSVLGVKRNGKVLNQRRDFEYSVSLKEVAV